MDHEHGGGSGKDLINFDGSSKHLRSYEATNDELSILAQLETPRSSSSSESSAEAGDVEKFGPTDPLLESKQADPETQGSGYNPGVSTQVSSTPSAQPQMTGHPAGYDPNRIPASVFSSKPTNLMEWSIASNESLFSIHMGNNSFSRDHGLLLYKSGEIPKLIDDMSHVPPSSNLVSQEENNERHIEKKQDSDVRAEELADTGKMKPQLSAYTTNALSYGTEKKGNQEKIPPAEEVRISSSSAHSFQFPLLDSEIETDGSVRVMMQRQHFKKQLQQVPQPQTPRKTPKTPRKSWFSCCYFGR